MRVYGLLGKTLKHSFSKAYFTQKFEAEGIPGCRYENFELASMDELPELIRSVPGLQGLNVTIPYKEAVLPFLHGQNDIVQEVKACNCIKITDGKLHGYNTDVIGFRQSLEKSLEPQHTSALVLGTGGAAKAVQYALKSLGIRYRMVSRSKGENTITYSELTPELIGEHLLVVNTSPLGMYPNVNEAPPLPYEALTSRHLLYDLIYNPEKTLFLQKGEAQGARIANGAEMLLLQAEESWKIWNSY
ncbi:shikimate dehydrogenase [Paraflavisolibacter sp. H34]|uniref:shikimate dehydrogenase family protein n=1 Tax=Huijunlia imazamoxiresistens TaxID=3127457 RepID=UPI00301A0492